MDQPRPWCGNASNVVKEEKDLCFFHGSSTSRAVSILHENNEAEGVVGQVQGEVGGNTGVGVDCHVKVD